MSINSTTYFGNLGSPVNINKTDAGYVIPDPFFGYSSPYKGLPYPGTTSMTLTNRKVTFAANTLGQTVKTYTTPYINDVQALCAYYADFGCSYEIQTGPIYTVIITVPFDEITQQDYYINQALTETWELTPVLHQKPLAATMQYVDSGLQITDPSNAVSFPDPVKAAIVYAFDNKQAVITQNPSSSVSIANYIPLAQTTLALMRAGYTSTPAWGQSLKRTAIVDINNSNNSFKTPGDVSFTAYMLNGNRTVIYSAKQMQFYYTIPPTITNLMLPSYKKPLSVTSTYGGVQVDTGMPMLLYAGWMVQPPTFQFITKTKVQLTQLFTWDEWLFHYYYMPGAGDESQYPLIANNAL
jgi:hypothetical protein